MSGPPSPDPGLGSLDRVDRIDRVCDRFEAEWKGGLAPRVEDFLRAVPEPWRPALLRELIALERELRRDGQPPAAAEYRDRFPGFEGIIAAAFSDPAGVPTGAVDMHAGASDAGIAASPRTISGPPRTHFDGEAGFGRDPLPEGPAGAIPAVRSVPRVPGYELFGELGRGGMGVVYKALHVRLDRLVALKMILDGDHSTPEARLRFLAEANAVARLEHPNIIRIHHVAEVDGLPFLELEYAEGGSLDRVLDGTPWPVRRAAELVEPLARAVAEAHRRGIVHRDLKPANVLLAADGTPKVTDFGLAKVAEVSSGLTRTELILGTPSYMAPEQAGGGARHAGSPADVHALGAILYELLTGRPPFKGASVLETLDQVRSAEPVAPSRLVDLPRDVETICLKCLQKDPARRYGSAGALADDLGRWRAGMPIAARPVAFWERASKRARRHPETTALAASVALAVIAGLAGVLWQWQSAVSHADRAWAREVDVLRVNDELQRILADLRYRTYVQNLWLAGRAWEEAQYPLMRRLLDESRPMPGEVDLRGFEWHLLDGQDRRQPRTLRLAGHAGPLICVAFSPDGSRIASAGLDEVIRIRDAATGEGLLDLEGHDGDVEAVAFSPDGSRIASAGADGTVRAWDAGTGRPVLRLRVGGDGVRGVAYGPDGSRIASANADGTATLWDAGTGDLLLTLRDGSRQALNDVAFSPDGGRLATAGSGGGVRIRDAMTGLVLHDLRGHQSPVFSVAFGPDGSRVASSDMEGAVKVWDATTGEEIHTLLGHTRHAWSVAFSPDGTRLASAGWDQTVRLWGVASGEELARLRGHDRVVRAVAFSPDGTRLASASWDSTVQVWDMAPRGRPAVATRTGRLMGIAFSPDGARLAMAWADGSIPIWDLAAEDRVSTFRGHDGPALCAAFSPDGRFLATGGEDRSIRLFDRATGAQVLRLEGHSGPVRSVAFGLDGDHLISASDDGTAKVWELPEAALVGTIHRSPAAPIAFGPGGLLAVVEGGSRVRILDARTGRPVRDLPQHAEFVSTVAFDPGGTRIATAGGERVVRVWDVANGRLLRTISGHTDHLSWVAFSPDGSRLATTSDDLTIRLWDTSTGQELLVIREGITSRGAVSFSPDGTRLAWLGRDGELKLWHAHPEPDASVSASPRR